MADPFIGQVSLFGFNFNPRGWLYCNGALLPISSNSTLFSLLGTFYGGDGRTSFGLPDLRGRAAMSYGRHPGSFYDWRMGQQAGSEVQQLTVAELAPHSHGATFTPTSAGGEAQLEASTSTATQPNPTPGCYLATNDGGRNPSVMLYRSDAGTGTVPLGGVSGGGGTGTVTVAEAGAGQAFSIMQPSLVLNYCISSIGTYPPRS